VAAPLAAMRRSSSDLAEEYTGAMAPGVLQSKLLRYAVYLKLAGRPGAWGHGVAAPDFLGGRRRVRGGSFLMLLLRSRVHPPWAVERSKKSGMINAISG